MKKKVALITILFTFFLIGCQEQSIATSTTTTETTNIVDTQYNVDVVNLVENLDFASQTLTIYNHSNQLGIPYVDIQEFIGVLEEGLVDIESSVNSDSISIVYKTYYSASEYITREMRLDSLSNTIYYNDFNFSNYLGIDNTEYETSLEIIDYVVNDSGVLSKMIDLDDYDLDILLIDDSFQISFHLANLLFTGNILNLYLLEDQVYITDDIETIIAEMDNYFLPESIAEAELIKYTSDFTDFLFDNFYGLKEEIGNSVNNHVLDDSSFSSRLEAADFSSATTLKEFDDSLQEFIYSLDDLHTTIIDFGYNKNAVELIAPESKTRTNWFYNSLVKNGYFNKDFDIQLTEEDLYYDLEIIELNLETKDKLANFFQDLDPNKKIIVDLTCCTGGNLIAVLELLAYVTDDPISFSYKNPATNECYTETYQAASPIALENEFQFYTSNATFSAAHLIVSIVKDNDLGIVFGNSTSGGACSVNYTILPNNLILTYSTNFLMLSDSLNPIEYGIHPDIAVSPLESDGTTYNEVNGYLSRWSVVELYSTNSTSNHFEIHIGPDRISEDVNILSYKITVYNEDCSEVLLSETTIASDSEYVFTHSFAEYKELIKIRVECTYERSGIFIDGVVEIKEELLLYAFDDFANYFTTQTAYAPVGIEFTTNCHQAQERDFIKVEITELAIYRVALNGSYNNDNVVYNLDGERIAVGNSFNLPIGTYIIQLDKMWDEGDYTVLIDNG
jgi:hypothetical protein